MFSLKVVYWCVFWTCRVSGEVFEQSSTQPAFAPSPGFSAESHWRQKVSNQFVVCHD